MSYDGWVELRVAENDAAELAEIGNYTSNVSAMWRRALTEANGGGDELGLGDTDGMGCALAAVLYRAAVAVMVRDEDELAALNPGNGWGDYAGALAYLTRARDVCQRFAGVPAARVRWDR